MLKMVYSGLEVRSFEKKEKKKKNTDHEKTV